MKLMNFTKRATQAGFTMIELLVVIAILGILAVAVLAAINPLEQIKRGSDTALKSDAEQLINAVDRFLAFANYYPWDFAGATSTAIAGMQRITPTWVVTSSGGQTCPVLSILSDGKLTTGVACNSVFPASGELKPTYKTKVLGSNMGGSSVATKGLFIHKQTNGVESSQYVCFYPESNAFTLEAKNRCVDAAGSGLPADMDDTAKTTICACLGSTAGAKCMVCLP